MSINNKSSDYECVKSGVPQGSVLEPMLFSIYLNDLLNQHEPASVIAYVNDLTLVCSGNNSLDALSSVECGVNVVNKWAMTNGTILNEQKCEAMFVSRFIRKSCQATEHLTIEGSATTINCVKKLSCWASQYHTT